MNDVSLHRNWLLPRQAESLLAEAKYNPYLRWERVSGRHNHGGPETRYEKCNADFQHFAPTRLMAEAALRRAGGEGWQPQRSFNLLRIEPGWETSPHQDLVQASNQHIWSLNVLLEPPEVGGVLKINSREIYMLPGDAVVYEASKHQHAITEVHRGTAYLLSVQVRF